jgi:hypothetical protein
MNDSSLQKPGRADLLVGQDAQQRIPTWFWALICGRMCVRGLPMLCFSLIVWLAPNPPWRRYRVIPRANPAAFRHDLLRGIQLELRRSGLVASPPVTEHSTH